METKNKDLKELFSGKNYVILYKFVNYLRFIFIAILAIYSAICLLSLGIYLLKLILSNHFELTFEEMRHFISIALFVLIILDFTSAMFYSKRIHYILTILEIGFIVITRKLILLDPLPENSKLIFALSLSAIGFFLLIFHFYKITGRLRLEKKC
jgi:uncharacterized membrane protein